MFRTREEGIWRCDGTTIRGNKAIGNELGTMDWEGKSVKYLGNTVKQSGAGLSMSGSNHLVEGNTFERYSYGGMVVAAPGTNNVVRHNRFQHSISSGSLTVRSAADVEVIGNVLEDNFHPLNISSGLGGIVVSENATNVVVRPSKAGITIADNNRFEANGKDVVEVE